MADLLQSQAGVAHVIRLGATYHGDHELIGAEVSDGAADAVLPILVGGGIDPHDVSMGRVEETHPLTTGRVEASPRWAGGPLVWSELTGSSRQYAHVSPRYLIYMGCAGVIAAFGILTRNQILVVGAMAISPDLLPLCAGSVSLLDRRYGLAARATATLVVGFLTATATACLLTAGLRLIGYPPVQKDLGDGGLGILTGVNIATVLVAAAAGIAGMLSFETSASSAVGVAISVTTIPAATFLGVAVAVGDWSQTGSAVAVLGVNVVVLIFAGSLTLVAQRTRRKHLVTASGPGGRQRTGEAMS